MQKKIGPLQIRANFQPRESHHRNPEADFILLKN